MFQRVFAGNQTMRIMRDVADFLSALKPDKKYTLELKEHRERRSLDANAYFWVIAHKLAEATDISVSDIYHNAIKEIGGVSEHYCGKPEAIKRLCEEWGQRGLGWISETYESKLDGMLNAILYYGSSTYDTKQMSRLIDNVIQDCHALDIETATPAELERMLNAWESTSKQKPVT